MNLYIYEHYVHTEFVVLYFNTSLAAVYVFSKRWVKYRKFPLTTVSFYLKLLYIPTGKKNKCLRYVILILIKDTINVIDIHSAF